MQSCSRQVPRSTEAGLMTAARGGFSPRRSRGLVSLHIFLFFSFQWVLFIPWVIFHPLLNLVAFQPNLCQTYDKSYHGWLFIYVISLSYDVEFVSGWSIVTVFLQVVWVGDPQRVFNIYTNHTNTTNNKGTGCDRFAQYFLVAYL